jgi:hypothetical protein
VIIHITHSHQLTKQEALTSTRQDAKVIMHTREEFSAMSPLDNGLLGINARSCCPPPVRSQHLLLVEHPTIQVNTRATSGGSMVHRVKEICSSQVETNVKTS